MAAPKVLVLRAPGTNCDVETAFAFEQAGAVPTSIHINQLLETPALAKDFQILCLPGGFSYGDDIAAGRILASQFRNHLVDVLHEFRAAGKLILGICNGFQILMKSGLLIPDSTDGIDATLTWNESGMYTDRWVHLQTDKSTNCVFLSGADQLYLPIAHAEGRFATRSKEVIERLASSGQLSMRYTDPSFNGQCLTEQVPFPANPNGSQLNVAGVCDESGRVFGLMPHPERYIDPTHHPHWTRLGTRNRADGTVIFQNAVRFFR